MIKYTNTNTNTIQYNQIQLPILNYTFFFSVPHSGFSMTPEIFSCQIKSGETIYGAIIRPTGRIPGKKYPTLVSVYGGPEVQLVTNSFMVTSII